MAQFSFSVDIDSIFPKGLNDESLALDMVKAGQEVMQKSIQKAALKHRKTGNMANSLKCSKPTINRNGDAVGRVKFYGKDKNGMQNWYKAIWIEYVRPARALFKVENGTTLHNNAAGSSLYWEMKVETGT